MTKNRFNRDLSVPFQLDIRCQQVLLKQEVHVFDTVSLAVPKSYV